VLDIIKRIYLLEYDIEITPYSLNTKKEHRVETFKQSERDMFIARYLELKDKYYIENIETGYANTSKIVNVDIIINSI